MTTESILDWVKSLSTKAQHYYCGTLNSKKDQSFGVYQLKDSRARTIAIGGLDTTKTGLKGISILVHWNTSTRATEDAAQRLYNDLAEAKDFKIGETPVNYINLLHDEPIDVGTDENGICERVIEFVIYYERR